MNLKSYIDKYGRGAANRLADRLQVSKSYLSQMVTGRTPISPARCVKIEDATNGEVSREELRPHDWQDIWPELKARR